MSFDFDAAVQVPHRMQPGLRRLAPGARQLTPTAVPQRGVARHLREKLAVLWAFRDQALLCAPGFDPQRALLALARHAAAEHPGALQINGHQWQAPGLGWALGDGDQPQATGGHQDWPEIGQLLRDTPPEWRRTALLCLAFAEDFAIVDAATGNLPWLAVALPSMWAPETKIGRSFAEAHAPVADNRLIVGAAVPLVKLVTGGVAPETPAASPSRGVVPPLGRPGGIDRWERFVWTLTAHPRLHGHPQRVDPARWAPGLSDEQLLAHTWWRTERQTFIPVPVDDAGSAQAVFTILVNVTPLAQAFTQPAQAARVHDALASMSDAVLAYRGLAAARSGLLRCLARLAGGRAGAAADPRP